MKDDNPLRNPSVVIAELQAILGNDPTSAALLAEAAQTLEYLQRGFLLKLQEHANTLASLKKEIKTQRKEIAALRETQRTYLDLDRPNPDAGAGWLN